MKLVPEWKKILRKAWSMKLILASAVFSGVEFALPFFAPEAPSQRFAFLALVCAILAGIFRVISQPVFRDEPANPNPPQ